MNNRAAWDMLKRKLLNVWVPAASILLAAVLTAG